VLSGIFGRKLEELTGGWSTLHNEELRNLYASPYIVTVIQKKKKERRMRWAEHVARMGAIINASIFRSENLKGTHHLGDTGIDGRVRVRLALGK